MLLNNRMELSVANVRNTAAGIAALGKYDQFAVVSPLIGSETEYFAFAKDPEHEGLRLALNASFGNRIGETAPVWCSAPPLEQSAATVGYVL